MGYRNFGLVIDQAVAASIDSIGLDIDGIGGISIHTEFGNITGTLTLQANDAPELGLTWQTITQVVFTQPAGSAGGEIIEIANIRARRVRVRYAHSSGTGVLKVAVHAKSGGI